MTPEEEIEYYKRAYERQKAARQEAERILEQKAVQLYKKNQELSDLNENLESELNSRINEFIQKEKSFEEIVDNASDIIYRVDLAGDFQYVNQRSISLTGYSKEELLSMNFSDLVVQPSGEEIYAFYLGQYEKNVETTYFEYQIKCKNGSLVWLGQNVQILRGSGNEMQFIGVARDITDRVETSINLRSSASKYKGILENINLGVIEVDNNEKIINVYDSFSQLTGYSKEELLGSKPKDFLLHPDFKSIMEDQNDRRKKGESSVYEVKMIRKDGAEIWVLISGAPYYNEQGEIEGSIGLHIDLTEQKNLENSLQEAKDKAESNARAKALFLANMSHEIRTPLNAIIGFSEILESNIKDSKWSKYINSINVAALNLAELVGNILDFSKIDSGKIELETKSYPLGETIVKALTPMELQAKSKGLNFSIELDFEEKEQFLFDKLRLIQVITNLVANAIKFTEKGLVEMRVSKMSEDQNTTSFKFEVCDTGIGVSKSVETSIFDEFIQEDASTERKYGGTGLGLSITKRIVELFGGELKFESEQGLGTIFYFEIELAKDIEQGNGGISTNILGDLSGLKVLVAEDNLFNQMIVKEHLEIEGAIILTAQNGEEAIQVLESNDVDIILMDVQMPLLNGVDATKKIRGGLNGKVPIVALTANAIEGDKEFYLSAGMNDYLSKPFSKNELVEVIRRCIDGNMPYQLLKIDYLKSVGSDDEDFVFKMLNYFLIESNQSLQKLKASKSLEEIKSITHKSKPSLNYISGSAFVDLMSGIESMQTIDHPLVRDLKQRWEVLVKEVKDYVQNRE